MSAKNRNNKNVGIRKKNDRLCFGCGCNRIADFRCKTCATVYCSQSCKMNSHFLHKLYCGKSTTSRTMQYLEDEKLSRLQHGVNVKDITVIIHKVVEIANLGDATIHKEYLYKSHLNKCDCDQLRPFGRS